MGTNRAMPDTIDQYISAFSPEDFRQFLHADLDKWSKLVKETGAKFD